MSPAYHQPKKKCLVGTEYIYIQCIRRQMNVFVRYFSASVFDAV